MRKSSVTKMATLAVLTALSVVLVLTIRVPLIPVFSFLEYDMGDIPILIATILMGPAAGFAITVIAALIQAVTVSAFSGWYGFVMHVVSSGTMLIVLWLCYKRNKGHGKKRLVLSLGVSTITMTGVMIVANMLLTPTFLRMLGMEIDLTNFVLVGVIPFNLLKGVITSTATYFLYTQLSKTKVWPAIDKQ